MKATEFVVREHVAARRLHRGRLFRKYFLLILLLVCGTLVISGGIGLYFAYQENKVALASLQREKAGAAAARIETFVQQIERQVAFAALLPLGQDLEARRVEFLKVLKLSPEVTDIAQLDAKGREQVLVSRLRMEAMRSGEDRSGERAFKEVRAGQTWFGPVTFRKDTEPYMSIAVRAGASGPVTIADVNLKFMWDVIQRIKIGQRGKAYVIDGTGHLIADPDIGLVLRKTDLSKLEQVRAALAPEADDMLAMLARDHAGNAVLTAHAPVEGLGWKVFVEQPVSEVFAALDATILRTIGLLVAGLLLSAYAALSLARNMVRPISTLQEGAARIGAGDLEQKIDVKTGDELETLAEQFNQMTSQLRESYAGLEKKVEERTAELQQTLEQQTATSEILKVISSSPTDVQPVLEAIVLSAVRLFPSCNVSIVMREGDLIQRKAYAGPRAFDKNEVSRIYPLPFDVNRSMAARAMIERRIIEIPDTDAAGLPDIVSSIGRAAGYRSLTIVPLTREGEGIGAIGLNHPQPGFKLTEKELALLRTFADQAVIAIENVRLFNETKESLEQQTAISEILRVISGSPSDVKPVLEAVAERAARICDAHIADIILVDGGVMRPAAAIGSLGRPSETPLDRSTVMGRSIVDQQTVHVADLQSEAAEYPLGQALAMKYGHRTILAVPLLREKRSLGTILLRRSEVRPFEEKHIALLKTFADQAAIAIENVRLFNETKESLERQTATAEVLSVISSSPTDTQPVFDAILQSATKLCDAETGILFRYQDGEYLALATRVLNPTLAELFKQPRRPAPGSKNGLGRLRDERRAVHIPDMLNDPAYAAGDPLRMETIQGGMRSWLGVPMLKEDELIGAIVIYRGEPRPFTEQQIALLQVFGDQAVIAIENVRLFNETKESLEQQTAIGEVLRVISSSPTNVEPVLEAVAMRAARICDASDARIFLVDGGELRHTAGFGDVPIATGLGEGFSLDRTSVAGRAVLDRAAVHIEDIFAQPESEFGRSRDFARRIGFRTVLAMPLMREDRALGSIILRRVDVRPFNEKQIQLLRTFADQAAIAIENVRLFREIQDKSAQLEVANKHKSDFLANMSHELRTPLNAIIGFSEVLIERMFGEVNAKQADYLKDIHESGKHLLSLINDILDLSKIEAGRMDLEISAFDLPGALSNAMTLVRERAQRHGIALDLQVDKRLGEFRADERKFKQIVVNLLSNAVKFTPDGGKVDVRARLDTDHVEIAVRDTGIGISPEDQQLVFEEFKQVGRDRVRKAEGTGLGLALTKRFVELHGGAIRLESALGKGSTFTITLPVRQP